MIRKNVYATEKEIQKILSCPHPDGWFGTEAQEEIGYTRALRRIAGLNQRCNVSSLS